MNWEALLADKDMETLVAIIEDCEKRKADNPDNEFYIGKMNLMISKCKEQMRRRGALVV